MIILLEPIYDGKKVENRAIERCSGPIEPQTETCKTEERSLSLNWKSSTENLWITNTKMWQQGWDYKMIWHER